MRLLIATDHYRPFIGGAHRWAELLAAGLARRGHQVAVATVWQGDTPRVQHSAGVTVHRVRQMRTLISGLASGTGQRHQPPFPDPATILDLRGVIAECDPEVIVAHGWIASSVAVALGGKDIPLLLSAHDYGYFCATRTLLYEGRPCTGPAPRKCLSCASGWYGAPKGAIAAAGVAASRRVLIKKMAAVQSVTSFVDEAMARHLLGGEGSRVSRRVSRFIVPTFLDIDPVGTGASQREVEKLMSALPEEPFILFVGALRPIKGVDVLFQAYGRLDAPPPLVLLGTFERDTPAIPPEATVLSDVPHRAVIAAWDRALFGVAPSVWPEPLGTVALEGASCGKAVIATFPGGMVDVLGDGAGILVPQGDATALADAMRLLIDDPARREDIGRKARQRSVAFQADAVLPRYEEILQELVERRATRAGSSVGCSRAR
jgi:glycosyltransferase involved in cell wall biosynthesis